MRSWMYCMRGEMPMGDGRGDTKSWFLYYRWEKDEEVWLPLSAVEMMKLERENRVPQIGDELWLVMIDGDIMRAYGKATITRLFEDNGNGRWEIWYDAGKVIAVPENVQRCQRWLDNQFGWYLNELPLDEKELLEGKIRAPS